MFKPSTGTSTYNAFGSVQEGESDDVGYTGHKFDTSLGLVYAQARYYDPVIGRFYSNDPVGFLGHLTRGDIQGFNRFVYVVNNPYSYSDPSGESPSNPMKPSKGGAALGYWAASAAEAYFDPGTAEHDFAVKMKAQYERMMKDGSSKVRRPSSRPGDFTKSQRDTAKAENARVNEGTMSCEDCGKPLRNVKNEPGKPTPDDQAQVHHGPPIKEGGGRDSKPVVLCPPCHKDRHKEEG